VTSYQLTSAGVGPEILAARIALTDGLEFLRIMLATRVRGDGAVPRTRNKPQASEPTTGFVPGGNSRQVSRLNKPTAAAAVESPTEIVELGDLPTELADAGSGGGPGADGGPDGDEPNDGPPGDGVAPVAHRPDPTDAVAEVWTLVERAQAGDADAFGQIYDRYLDTVFRFIYFRVGNRQLAEDLTADTFLRALKRIGSFTWQGRDPGAWLVTIARNLVADHFKSGRYRLEVTTGDVLDADREDRGPEGSPEAAVVDHITNVALLTAVKQLNPEQQECIVLRFLHGFSVAETAQAMGKNEGAIKALQYRAVRALARLLPDGFQP
jgi:RNA polymerase sigma-70 factor, ECF subfamily